ncbi:ROK family protein [Pelotalea chapellei]|uniref:ROK family protein n=1 Tax=Pelotalea chapellei TaxID=44671 RepID=A0ABS5UD44_9BACT|nr:ROK family protein [Pelotalea chapellei]MBT1073543.1 ROK family protein [Pelotalea chapellei]
MDSVYIGIDIGGTNLRFALVGEDGTILKRSRCASSIEQGREAFCKRLTVGISEMLDSTGTLNAPVAGIGVGVPGVIGSDGMIYSSVNMRPLDGFNLTTFLTDTYGTAVACGNDANVIALGEHAYGAGRGLSSYVVISIGTGLGSGLILDGRLWTGVGGFAAEFGHSTVDPEGIPCPCGNRGCLEQYVSAGAVVRFARQYALRERLNMIGDNLDAALLAKLARQGDPTGVAAYKSAGGWLGVGLASLVNTLNLEAVIIRGGVAESLDLMLPALNQELSQRCFSQMRDQFSILSGECGDDAGLLGAVALVRNLSDQ